MRFGLTALGLSLVMSCSGGSGGDSDKDANSGKDASAAGLTETYDCQDIWDSYVFITKANKELGYTQTTESYQKNGTLEPKGSPVGRTLAFNLPAVDPLTRDESGVFADAGGSHANQKDALKTGTQTPVKTEKLFKKFFMPYCATALKNREGLADFTGMAFHFPPLKGDQWKLINKEKVSLTTPAGTFSTTHRTWELKTIFKTEENMMVQKWQTWRNADDHGEFAVKELTTIESVIGGKHTKGPEALRELVHHVTR